MTAQADSPPPPTTPPPDSPPRDSPPAAGPPADSRLPDSPPADLRLWSVGTAAAALVVLHLVLRAVVAAQGWFLLDDMVFFERVVREPFGPEMLLADHAGHLMPGSFLLVVALESLVPLHWPAAVGLMVLGQLAVDVAVWRLLVALFGRRPAILLPFAVFTTTSLTLPASVWWAVAVNQIPMQLAMALALLAWVRYLRHGGRADAVRAALAVAGGLLFAERTLLVVPLIVLLTLLWFDGPGDPVTRAVLAWRRHRFAALLLGGVGAVYTVYYLATVSSPFSGLPDANRTVALAATGLVEAVLPGLLGGPWAWADQPVTIPVTATPPVLVWASAVVAGLVVAASVAAHSGAARAWVLPAVALGADYLLVAASRAQIYDAALFGREYRYVTDVALAATLAVGLAFLPVAGARTVLHRRQGPLAGRLRAALRPAPARALSAALVGVLVVGSVVSGAGYAARWSVNPAREYLAAARADLAAAPGTVLVDGPVPDPVMWSLLAPHNLASAVLAAAPENPVFLVDGAAVGALRVLDTTGHVRTAWVPPIGEADPGPVEQCGWPVSGPGQVTVPLRTPVGPARWIVRITWLSALDNFGRVAVGDQVVQAAFPAGLNEVFMQVTGQVDDVRITLADPNRPLCVGQVEVGLPSPLPEGFR